MPKTFVTTARNAQIAQVTPKQMELLRALRGYDRNTTFEGAKLIVKRHPSFGDSSPQPKTFQAKTAYDLRDRGFISIATDGTGRISLKDDVKFTDI